MMKNIKIRRKSDNILTTIYKYEINFIDYANKKCSYISPYEHLIWYRYMNKDKFKIIGKLCYTTWSDRNLFSLTLIIIKKEKFYIELSVLNDERKSIEEEINKLFIAYKISNEKMQKMIKEEYMKNFKEAENIIGLCFGV